MRIPDCPNKPTIKISGQHEYHIKLITPMFGGGVSTRVNDLSFPIRPTSIRGQLQFWWRATVGAQYATSTELRAAQSAVWGDTTQASRVQVSVKNVKATVPVQCAHYEYIPSRNNKPARHNLVWNEPFSVPVQRHWGRELAPKPVTYALFPFQGKKAELIKPGCMPKEEPAHYIPSADFDLTIKCDTSINFEKQIEPALWAWVNFGGLGSRTRRGCGSLFSPNINLSSIQAVRTWLRDKGSANTRLWPTLPNVIYAKLDPIIHFNAWNDTIAMLRYFRQGDDEGRDPGNNPNQPLVLGQSRFPEPDTIRHLLNSWDHPPRNIYPQRGYPRAEFGLPIIFHFMGNGIPPDTTLQPVVNGKIQDRMASPFILKPLAISTTNSIPCVLKMNTLPLDEVVLMNGNNEVPHSSSYPIRSSSFAAMNPSPMRGFSSAIDAFLKYAKDEGYTTN